MIESSESGIRALDDEADAREFDVSVAGAAALLVANLHQVHDRIATPSRQDNKDVHDIHRLLRAVEADALSAARAPGTGPA